MKTVDEFLSELNRLNIKIWKDGEHLCYEAPNKILTPNLLRQLREHKTEILILLSQTNAATRSRFGSIPSIPRNTSFPLSFAQARLWFIEQLQPSTSTYNIPGAYRLTGHVDVTALDQSLNEIIRRHEVLRTSLPTVDGQPSQIISPNIALSLSVKDLQEYPEREIEVIAQQIAIEEAKQPFDLANGPLFRIKLLRLAEAEYVLLLNMHHIISDGWSFKVFFQELAALYTAFSTDKRSPLLELPIQYADFAYWQREWLKGEFLESQLSYWKRQLGGSLPILQLPTDYPRPPVSTYQGAYQSVELPLDLTKALKALSQRESVTLFMVLLAAFQTLLHRYSGQEDIIVGTPIAGRNQIETEGLIGFFVNSLAIRTNLSDNPNFQQLLARVREITLVAYDHQDLPLEKLVEELQPERDLSRSPLFQVMFVFHNTPSQSWELPGLTITPLEVHSGTSKFDLTLDLQETSEGIKGGIEYNTDLFKSTTIARMANHFQTLLESIVANPQQHILNLSLLTATEQHQLLVEWNKTQTDYPKDICIHELFEEQVAKTPSAVAVIFDEQQFTYQQLNHRANQLAHYLKLLGVKPEISVGICIERSLDLIVGLLGILKAGGAYVPLDPAYPSDRLAFMLYDAAVPVLLTQKHLIDKLPSHQAKVVCLDTDWEAISQEKSGNLITDVKPNNLAYILYTSGSTGQPKGIAIEHKNTVNFIHWAQTSFTKEQLAGILASTSICFDLSIFELFVPLSCGGKVILAENVLHLSTLKVAKDVTLINTVPSVIAELIRTNAISQSVRTVNLAGESLSSQLVNQLYQYPFIQEVYNLYGPTEATTYSTFSLCSRHRNNEKAINSSIGRPLANTQIYILDSHLHPVPVGIPGELYIGGAGLARGYLKRPELTKEKFIPNPFSNELGERLYKTGDLARYRSDGDIEFLGRLDNQVKVRGFRIELGEIEAVLAKHPSVQQTFVATQEDSSTDKRLVAYIVPHLEQTLTSDELYNFLKQKLPAYMLPSAFIFLYTLPLTPNGKIDRRVLPPLKQIKEELENTYIAPRDKLELKLTKIWENVLGIQPIGIRDNFFKLGGHSLLAVRLFSEIEKVFKKNLPLAILFQTGTIEQLAIILRQSGLSIPLSCLVPIQPHGSKIPLFLCQGVSLYQPLISCLDSEQPVYGLIAEDGQGKAVYFDRIEKLAAYHIEEIRTIQPEGPYLLGGLSFGGIIALEVAQQLISQGHKVALLALFDSHLPRAQKVLSIPINQKFLYYLNYYLNKLFQIGPMYFLERLKWRLKIVYGKIAVRNELFRIKRFEHIVRREAYFQGIKNYSKNYIPKVYLGCITLFVSCDRVNTNIVQAQPELGWADLAAGGLKIHQISGDHLGILKEPNVQLLAEKLKVAIDEGLNNVKAN